MTILMDHQIRKLCQDTDKPMIYPYVPHQVKVDESGRKILSYGESSGGYDVRLAEEYKVFSNITHSVIDPLAFDDSCLVDKEGPFIIVPPHGYILGRTIETFNIPDDVLVVCVGKSTLARCSLAVNCTPIEPGFSGQVVIEVSNQCSLPVKIYANQGIAQFLFFKGSEPCEVSYVNKKYQNQTGIQLAKV